MLGFSKRPFAVSPEGDYRVSFNKLTLLNHNHQSAQKHAGLLTGIGKGWVCDKIDRSSYQYSSGSEGKRMSSKVQELGQLQTSLFELLWTSTVEQLKRHGSGWEVETNDPTSPPQSETLNDINDPERDAFQHDLADLEKSLQEAILKAKKQRFAISFCGMVKAGKSLFLNALIGAPILPSDGTYLSPALLQQLLCLIC
jgi:hypothetical protein